MRTVGSLVYQYFEHHLKAEKGLAPTSIRCYRDGIRLFLLFLASKNRPFPRQQEPTLDQQARADRSQRRQCACLSRPS